MNKQPLCLCVSIFLILTLIVAGFIVTRRFGSRSSDLDYDAEVDVENIGNATASTLWDLHRNIKTKNKMKIYLFHVLNPDDVLTGQKPKLKEVGPFTYDQHKSRITLGIYTDSDSVRYKDHVDYHFNPAESKGNDSNIVTIINMPWVGLAQEVARMSALSRYIVMAIVSRYSESVFMTRPVGQLLFGGFYHELISTFSGITGETYMPNNTFGFFYGRNDTFLDPREVNLGLRNPANFGHTLKWKGQKEMEWWSGGSTHSTTEDEDDDWFSDDDDEEDEAILSDSDKKTHTCNQISESSDWNLFHPGVKKGEVLTVFADDMCRNLKFKFEKEINLGGVSGYRFTMAKEEYADSRKHPENACYCSHPGDNGEDCPKDGAYQINACQKGASVLISNPHFYHGDSSYVSDAGGALPKKERHESFIDIEPITGQVLRYSKKNQINLHLRPLKSIADFNHVPNMIFPVMWTDETAIMGDEALVELKVKLDADKFSLDSIKPIQQLGFLSRNDNKSTQTWSWMGGFLILPVGLVGLVLAIRGRFRASRSSSSSGSNSGSTTSEDEVGEELVMLGDEGTSSRKVEIV